MCFGSIIRVCFWSICRTWIITSSGWGRTIRGLQADIRQVDAEAGKLIEAARAEGAEVVVVSEYGITQATLPVHINRVLREAGVLTVRLEPLGWETLDAGASRAFAVADHQIAHVYVREANDVSAVKERIGKDARHRAGAG